MELFPSIGMQVLSSLIHFLGVTVVTHCLSRRLAAVDLSVSGIFALPWSRLCLLLIFLESWAFLCIGGVLIFGVGLDVTHSICHGAILLCIACYATSKLLIYCFLIERVHIVWTPAGATTSRFKSLVDILCYLTVAPYFAVIVLLVIGRISELRTEDQACVIGLKPLASIPLLSYDLYINLFLTALFLWPLLKNGHLSPNVKRLAVRTLIAAIASLTTSTVNIAILTARHGREYGWVCLGSCGADVIVNALALYWATIPRHRRQGAPIGSDDVELMFSLPKPTGRGASNAFVGNTPETATCNLLQELQSADHSTKNSQRRAMSIGQYKGSRLASPPPSQGIFKSVSRVLKRTETPRQDKQLPIEVNVSTHCQVDGESAIPPSKPGI